MVGNNLTPIVKILLIANIGIFLIAKITNFNVALDFMALRHFSASGFSIHQIITHMFMHGDFLHLFFNMFGVFMFGPALENIWGGKRFLIFYFFCGLGSALIFTGVNTFEYQQTRKAIDTYRVNPNPYDYELIMHKNFNEYKKFPQLSEYFVDLPREYKANPENKSLSKTTVGVLNEFYELKLNKPMVGASGALFGILLGFGMLFPNTLLMMLFIPVPIKAKYFVMIYGALELFAGLQNRPEDNIAHFAHLGGMIFAFILIKYWQNQRNSFY